MKDRGFKDMEVAFGVKHKHDNLSKEEKGQFDDMVDFEEYEKTKLTNLGKAKVQPDLNTVQKNSNSDAEDYYKVAANRVKDYQKPNQTAVQSRIGEDFAPVKVNVDNEDQDEDFMYNGHMGTGMSGLRYDDEGSENNNKFNKRIDDLNDGDETYAKLKKYGDKYKDYKYGDKYEESEEEYQETPKVRTTQKESVKYSDVMSENIFKTKGRILSESQVLKVAKKVPSRVKIDETVFAITDGENFYRLIWEGDNTGEPVMTHQKLKGKVNESIEKMKHLWDFNSSETISTKTNIKESGDEAFRKIYNKIKGNNLLG